MTAKLIEPFWVDRKKGLKIDKVFLGESWVVAEWSGYQGDWDKNKQSHFAPATSGSLSFPTTIHSDYYFHTYFKEPISIVDNCSYFFLPYFVLRTEQKRFHFKMHYFVRKEDPNIMTRTQPHAHTCTHTHTHTQALTIQVLLNLSTTDIWSSVILCHGAVLCPVDYPTHPQVVTIKNVSRHCQMSPGGQSHARSRTPAVHTAFWRIFCFFALTMDRG